MLEQLTDVARSINERPGAAERLFPSAESSAAAYDAVREDLARGFAPWERSLRPYVDRRAALQAALEVAPSALESIRQGLARNEPLTRETAALARATVHLTRPAPAALRGAAALLRESGPPLRDSRTLLQRSADSVPPTLTVARRTDPLIPPIIANLTGNLPFLNGTARARCDVLGWLRNWHSMLAWGVPSKDPIGPQTALRSNTVTADGAAEAEQPHTGSRFPSKICAFGEIKP
jgi:ABC-type transporter Mla subunit MlaD